MQFPAETVLVEALRAAAGQEASGSGGGGGGGGPRTQWMAGLVRVPDGRGPAGSTGGVGWGFQVGRDGVEVYTEE